MASRVIGDFGHGAPCRLPYGGSRRAQMPAQAALLLDTKSELREPTFVIVELHLLSLRREAIAPVAAGAISFPGSEI
ncbi:hypothetical protein D7T60_01985 [Stenotrophomonas maltophilia]|nr:hypothetical protein [Stenotrophomonas maltophilia]MBA0543643.1 hypothetical protein [Stenotrophomonas maltophilia]